MQEHEVIEIIQVATEQAYSQLQWWATVSFGLIAMTYVAAKRLTLSIVIGVVILYTSFTVFTYLGVTSSSNVISLYMQELARLEEAGSLSEAGMDARVRMESLFLARGISINLCIVGTFVGAVLYLLFSYRRERLSSETSIAS
jgi:hypothetical protein